MKSQFFIAFVSFCLFVNILQAQSNFEDVVYLKNGGVTRGRILEIIPDSSLKIETKDRNIFVYRFNEIEKILKVPIPATKEEIAGEKRAENLVTTTVPNTVKADINEFKKEGFHNITKFGPLGFTNYSFNFINGYQFNPYILLGLGVGLDAYKGLSGGTDILPFTNGDPKYTNYFLPIFMDFRFHVSKTRATFLVFFDMGYSVYLTRTANDKITSNQNNNYYNRNSAPSKGGTFFCPGIGFKVFLNKRIGVVADMGLKFQNYTSTSIVPNNTGSFSSSRGLVVGPVLNIGLAF
jgi:hypothetical protein